MKGGNKIMNNKNLTIVLVVVALAVGAYFVMQSNSDDAELSPRELQIIEKLGGPCDSPFKDITPGDDCNCKLSPTDNESIGIAKLMSECQWLNGTITIYPPIGCYRLEGNCAGSCSQRINCEMGTHPKTHNKGIIIEGGKCNGPKEVVQVP